VHVLGTFNINFAGGNLQLTDGKLQLPTPPPRCSVKM